MDMFLFVSPSFTKEQYFRAVATGVEGLKVPFLPPQYLKRKKDAFIRCLILNSRLAGCQEDMLLGSSTLLVLIVFLQIAVF